MSPPRLAWRTATATGRSDISDLPSMRISPRHCCVVPEGTRVLLSCLPSVEALGYLLSRRTALVRSTAPHRFENQSSFAPDHPAKRPSASLRAGSGGACRGPRRGARFGEWRSDSRRAVAVVTCRLSAVSGCSSSSKTPTQGQTKALNGAPAH